MVDRFRSGCPSDHLRPEGGRLDQPALRAAHRPSRVRGRGLRFAQGDHPRQAAGRAARGTASGGAAGIAGARHRRDAGRQDDVGQQQDEQPRLCLLDARPEAARRRGSRRSPGLADVHARQQVSLRRQCRLELGVRDRHRHPARGHARAGRSRPEAQLHGGDALQPGSGLRAQHRPQEVTRTARVRATSPGIHAERPALLTRG